MLLLPTVLQIRILQLATDIPHYLETTPRPDERFLPEDDSLDAFIRDLRRALPTRHTLTLVSRTFNTLATPLLCACLHLTTSSTPRIYSSLTPSNFPMVHHVILDFPPGFGSIPVPDRELISIFSRLSDVRVLSIHSMLPNERIPPPVSKLEFKDPALYSAIATSLGPTLCKLILYRHALVLFPPSEFSVFTASLVRLEALVAFKAYIPSKYKSSQLGIPLPMSMPHLTCLNIGKAPFTLPAEIAPTHVQHPTDAILHSILTPALTHLSLAVPETPPFDTYTSLPSKAPNLVSLALSGRLSDITRLLADCPLPSVSYLRFQAIKPTMDPEDATEYVSGAVEARFMQE